MELIHNDSQGIYFEINYQEALQLVYLGLLNGNQLDRWSFNEEGNLTVYINAKDDKKAEVKLRIKEHFEKLEET